MLSRRIQVALMVLVAGVTLASPSPIQLSGSDQFGRKHDLTDASVYTVVDFAAAWCEPCYQALPELEALAISNPRIRFLVISVDEDVTGRDRLIKDLGLQLPVIWDKGHQLIESFHPKGFPATYVLAPDGKIVHQHIGFSEKKWQRLVDFLDQLGSHKGPLER